MVVWEVLEPVQSSYQAQLEVGRGWWGRTVGGTNRDQHHQQAGQVLHQAVLVPGTGQEQQHQELLQGQLDPVHLAGRVGTTLLTACSVGGRSVVSTPWLLLGEQIDQHHQVAAELSKEED